MIVAPREFDLEGVRDSLQRNVVIRAAIWSRGVMKTSSEAEQFALGRIETSRVDLA